MFHFRGPDPEPASRPSARGEQGSEIAALRGDVERLYFITEALWRLLKEKHGLSDTDIIREIAVIDLEDGRLDGRKAPTPPPPCPKCGRVLSKHRPKCMFCGEPVALNPFDR
jgi:hypothetical protein